jgi:mono/diheme cytochrome c family protein
MKNLGLVLLTLALASLVLACTNQPSQPQSSAPSSTATPVPSVDEFAAARANYAKLCIDCHGATGEGGTVKIDDKPLKVPSLKEGHALTHSEQQLVKQVLDGGEGMPAFKDKVSTTQAAELVRYIRHDFQGK